MLRNTFKNVSNTNRTKYNIRRNLENFTYLTYHKGYDKRSIVATTRWNGTCDMLTSAKLSVGYLVVGITRELDKELSLHCYPIYISYKWSMLQQCVYLMSTLQ